MTDQQLLEQAVKTAATTAGVTIDAGAVSNIAAKLGALLGDALAGHLVRQALAKGDAAAAAIKTNADAEAYWKRTLPRVLVLVLLGAALMPSSAFAADAVPLDAPRAVELGAGDPAPYAGTLLNEPENVRRTQAAARDNEIAAPIVRGETVPVPRAAFIGMTVGGVVLAVACAVLVGLTVAPKSGPPGP